jgi:hypothetical protein
MAKAGAKQAKGEALVGVFPQPTLPDVTITDKELLRARSKASSRKGVAKDWDQGMYRGRK